MRCCSGRAVNSYTLLITERCNAQCFVLMGRFTWLITIYGLYAVFVCESCEMSDSDSLLAGRNLLCLADILILVVIIFQRLRSRGVLVLAITQLNMCFISQAVVKLLIPGGSKYSQSEVAYIQFQGKKSFPALDLFGQDNCGKMAKVCQLFSFIHSSFVVSMRFFVAFWCSVCFIR